MLFPNHIVTVDGVEMWWVFQTEHARIFLPSVLKNCEGFVDYIERKQFYHGGDYHLHPRSKHFFSRCGYGGVVRHNSNQTINKFKKQITKELCSTCRGKGHPWTAEIWNGKPFRGRPKGDEWNHLLKCKDCNGEGAV